MLAITSVHADEAPAARAYLDELQISLNCIAKDLPAITALAERAADAYIRGESIIIMGEALQHELMWRPGGLMDFGDGRPGLKVGMDATADIQLVHHASSPQQIPATSAAVMWTWTAELFAACTRRGQTPALRIHRDIDYRRRWFNRYRDQRFHKDVQLNPIPPGVLGKRYLNATRTMLLDIGAASFKSLAHTARRSADTIISGHRTYLRSGGPYLPFYVNDHLFTQLNHDGGDPTKLQPGRGDFVIAIGQAQEPGSGDFGEPEMFRRASRGVAWCVGAYQHRPGDLQRGEIVINQQWPVGEAMVNIRGHKARLAPAGSIAALTVYHMLLAEVNALVEDHRAHSKRPIAQPPDPPAHLAPKKKQVPINPPPADEPQPDNDQWIFATLFDHVHREDL
jgi:hypothetical protein